jgi:hypothetical protein
MVGWDWYGFDTKHAGTRYIEFVFVHPVGSAGHVVHSGVSGVRNIDVLFFMLTRAPMLIPQRCAGTRYAEHVFCI